MDSYNALVFIPNLICFALIAWVAFKVYTGKDTDHRKAMTVCFTFVAVNSLVLLMEKLFSEIEVVRPIVLVEYVCESIILISLLVFVLQYVGLGRLVTTRNILLIGSPGMLVVLLNATNEWHHLFYLSIELVNRGGFYVFEAEYGPLFLIWMANFLGILIITVLLVVRALFEAPQDGRGGIRILLLAMAIVVVTGVLYVFSPRNDPALDVLSIGLSLTALTIFLGERHSDFDDLQIIRFMEAIGGMDDAIIILGSSLNIVYANANGKEVLKENEGFLKDRLEARGLKVPVGSNKWDTAMTIKGSPRHMILSTSDIFRSGRSIGVVLVLHDITDRRELEEELRRANHGLSTLNQIIRHDIRNDLVALGGYLELLEKSELSTEQKELVRKMSKRAESADGNLTFVKNVQASQTATIIWQDVQGVMESALSGVDLQGIKLESRVQGIKLFADRLLPNVFHCLADNAVRHGSKVQKILVRGEETSTGLSLIWEDDGIGVPPEDKENIFLEGFGKNTGQGLFLAREILSATGFSITEEGEAGQGARFVIRAPSGKYTWNKRTSGWN